MIERPAEERQQEAATIETKERRAEKITHIERTLILPDVDQMRQHIPPEQVERTAQSLKRRGMLQPIRVRHDPALGMYPIVSGHIRYFASAPDKANLKTLPCIIIEGEVGELDQAIDQFTENAVRQDFNPVEYGRGIQRIASLSGMSGVKLARELGVSEADISISQTLLQNPAEILADIADGTIGKMIGYYLATCNDSTMRFELWQRARHKQVTKEQVKDEVATSNNGGKPPTPKGGKGKKVVAKHKSGVSFPIDLKRPFTETKAAVSWLNRLLVDCKSIDDLKARLGFDGKTPQPPAGEAPSEPDGDDGLTEEEAA